MPDIIKSSRTAFVLAYAIAYRARWNVDAPNPYGLQLGEAVCDYVNWGLSEQEFRTAKRKLEEWKLATFKSTSRGTIGKLVTADVFEVLPSRSNEQINAPANDIPRAKSVKEQRKDIGSDSLRSPDIESPPEEKTEPVTTVKPEPDAPEGADGATENDNVTGSLSSSGTNGSPQCKVIFVPYAIPTWDEVLSYGQRRGHDPEGVSQWYADMERNGWTIRGHRVRWWKLALDAFAEKYENDTNLKFEFA